MVKANLQSSTVTPDYEEVNQTARGDVEVSVGSIPAAAYKGLVAYGPEQGQRRLESSFPSGARWDRRRGHKQ